MGGGDRDLKVEAIRGGVRDLKIDDAAAMRGDLKMEDAAMEGGDLNLELHSVAIGEGFHELWIGEGDRDLKAKTKDAGSSEGGDTLKRKKPWEVPGGILELKKEALKAMNDWFRTHNPEWISSKEAEKAQALLAGKKMKVVKTRFCKEFINKMAQFPLKTWDDLTDEQLAQLSPYFCKLYTAAKVFEDKHREYYDVLADQQKELGYAEDEIEVTDDEEEEAMVKN